MPLAVTDVQNVLRVNLRTRPKDLVMCLRFTNVLLDKVGKERLSKPIDVEGYFTILVDVIEVMLSDEHPDCVAYMQSTRRLNESSNWLAGLRRDAKASRDASGSHHLSADTVFGGPLSSLNQQLKAKFRRGETVTYEDILRSTPEMFFALA